ncbi:alpha/beta fold hydrolase [Nonomuraea sp. NPDC050663]|uniref:alpha/beta fold hydrolase n=1 Tax=Nonomuraea sp. NPDC050663 TaxID=3364370 RepID=UPI003793A9D1
MTERRFLDISGQRHGFVDFGGEGPPVLLLHDTLARATTWARTAQWMTPRFHVIATDLRGHGWSAGPDESGLLDQLVSDAVAVIEDQRLQRVAVVGHGLGALVAWTLAGRRPDLVRALVLEDHGIDTYSAPPALIRSWFESWPLPFASVAEIDDFFTTQKWPRRTPFFRESFVETETGYRPLFEFEHVLRAMEGWNDPEHWKSLSEVRCPALVVRGAGGMLPEAELRAMAERLPHGSYTEVEGAGHVIHYDQPDGWRAAVEPFLVEHS